MFKNCLLIILLSVFLMLSGCADTDKTLSVGETYNLDYDDQYMFEKPIAHLISMAESRDGYYFFSGANSSFLYCIDKKSMKTVILCNKPDCLHADEPDPAKIANCNAFFMNPGCIIYYNSNLYIFDSDGKELYQVSLDGTRKMTVCQFKNTVDYAVIHRGYLYCSVSDYGLEKGRTDSSKTECKLLRIDLSNTSKEPAIMYEFSGIEASINNITGFKNAIYFNISAYTDSSLQSSSQNLMYYDIQDGSIREVGKDIGGAISINGSKLVYVLNKQAYRCNLDGSDRKILNGIKGNLYLYSDENYILEDTIFQTAQNGQRVKRQLNVYDLEGNLLNSIDLHGFGTQLMYGGDSNYLFFPDRSKKNKFGTIHTLWALEQKQTCDSRHKTVQSFRVYTQGGGPGHRYERLDRLSIIDIYF